MNEIYVSGHRNPDTDSIVASMAYARLRNALGDREYKAVRIGAIAKGRGMIHPNMATMLCFVTTDCAISVPMLQKAIKAAADTTFNMISVDGDTSTNDTLAIMANGEAENEEITEENEAYKTFLEALTAVCRKLSMMMAGDGEGATKLLICNDRREGLGDGEDGCKVRHLLLSAQGCHVRRRRQLGSRAVRHRLCRRGYRHQQGGRVL